MNLIVGLIVYVLVRWAFGESHIESAVLALMTVAVYEWRGNTSARAELRSLKAALREAGLEIPKDDA